MRAFLRRILNSPEPIPVKRIGASRALFLSEGVSRIDITVELDYGNRIRLEMDPQLAHKLIRELTASYIAINPPIRNYGGGVPFDGGGQ